MTGAELIAAERLRQLDVEGYTVITDSLYSNNELVRAAICYAAPAGMRKDKPYSDPETVFIPMMWPWAFKHWKPTADDRVRELVKAGALIAAEIDRLQIEDRIASAERGAVQ